MQSHSTNRTSYCSRRSPASPHACRTFRTGMPTLYSDRFSTAGLGYPKGEAAACGLLRTGAIVFACVATFPAAATADRLQLQLRAGLHFSFPAATAAAAAAAVTATAQGRAAVQLPLSLLPLLQAAAPARGGGASEGLVAVCIYRCSGPAAGAKAHLATGRQGECGWSGCGTRSGSRWADGCGAAELRLNGLGKT